LFITKGKESSTLAGGSKRKADSTLGEKAEQRCVEEEGYRKFSATVKGRL
jgi:hypothetical protein